jgi:hypothetical protein
MPLSWVTNAANVNLATDGTGRYRAAVPERDNDTGALIAELGSIEFTVTP